MTSVVAPSPAPVMPHTIEVDPAGRLARIHMSGTLHGEEIVEAAREVFLHPDWESGFSTLWLTEDVESIDVLPEHVETYEAAAGRIRSLRGPGRSAVVARSTNVELTALLLSLKTMSKGGSDRSTRVFKDVAAAEAWLTTGDAATE